MSNQAKDWQKGTYGIRVKDNVVEVSAVRCAKKGNYDSLKKYSATARCDPEDEFSLSMGVALAMDRLNKLLEDENGKIEVGDIVTIINRNLAYPQYSKWVLDNVKDPKSIVKYAYDTDPLNGGEYKVLAIAPHSPDFMIDLAYIRSLHWPEPCYLIGVGGLEKV